MMRILGLVIAFMVIASVSYAIPVTVDLYAGDNWFALPNAPTNVGNWEQGTYNSEDIMNTAGLPAAGWLEKIDSATQSSVIFDPSQGGSYAWNMLLGEGYSFNMPADFAAHVTLSYDGVYDGIPSDITNATTRAATMTDMWISLPGVQIAPGQEGGWNFFGHPFAHDTAVDDGSGTGANIKFTDGTQVLSWLDAGMLGWIDGTMYGVDPLTQNGIAVNYDGSGDPYLRAGHGYQFYTFKNNIAMIIPAH